MRQPFVYVNESERMRNVNEWNVTENEKEWKEEAEKAEEAYSILSYTVIKSRDITAQRRRTIEEKEEETSAATLQ